MSCILQVVREAGTMKNSGKSVLLFFVLLFGTLRLSESVSGDPGTFANHVTPDAWRDILGVERISPKSTVFLGAGVLPVDSYKVRNSLYLTVRMSC